MCFSPQQPVRPTAAERVNAVQARVLERIRGAQHVDDRGMASQIAVEAPTEHTRSNSMSSTVCSAEHANADTPSTPSAPARGALAAIARPLLAGKVRIHSVSSHPQLNGRMAAVISRVDSVDTDERWVVEVDGVKYDLPTTKLEPVPDFPLRPSGSARQVVIDVLDSQPSPAHSSMAAAAVRGSPQAGASRPLPDASSPQQGSGGIPQASHADTMQPTPPDHAPLSSPEVSALGSTEVAPPSNPPPTSPNHRAVASQPPVQDAETAEDAVVAETSTEDLQAAPAPVAAGDAEQAAASSSNQANGQPAESPAANQQPSGDPPRRRIRRRVWFVQETQQAARWTCSSCDEPNSEAREQCNNCGGPRPPTTQEASTPNGTSADGQAPIPNGSSADRQAPPPNVTSADEAAHSRSSQPEPAAIVAASQATQPADNSNAGVPECTICMDALVDTVFVPCGHMAACAACAKRLGKKPPCPVCRKKIKIVQPVFRA